MPAINPISQSNQFEFNDSVLTTKAWNSSRYDGRQLSGQSINKARSSDISYGRTPVISNLTRTFYISSDITSLHNTGLRADRVDGNIIEDTENPIEDPTLQYIPDFSYIIINKAVTINDDNSIKITDLSTFNDSPEGIDKRVGFDREFQTNIPNGSFIGIKNLDADIKDRSNIRYPVYFNEGRLQPIMRVISYNNMSATQSSLIGNSVRSNVGVFDKRKMKVSYNTFHKTDSPNTAYWGLNGTTQHLPNKSLLATFTTGSFIETDLSALAGFEAYHGVGSFNKIDDQVFRHLNDELEKEKGKKAFITLLSTPKGGGPTNIPNIDPTTAIPPIRTTSRLNTSESFALNTKDLAELSTAQFAGYRPTQDANSTGSAGVVEDGAYVTMSFNHQFNQHYENGLNSDGTMNMGEVTEPSTAPFAFSGSYDVSILNEEKPALLVNLRKDIQFPEGIGRTPLVIMPETLHPYVRDNIPQFMAQAGFDIGDITQVNTLDETNRNLS